MSILEIIKNNKVIFNYYRAGNLYYNIIVNDKKYQFPVPIEDIGQATFSAQHKAITLMRYIRKAVKNKTFVISA